MRIFCSILLSACLLSNTHVAHANSLPDWVRLPSSDTTLETWGIGSGKDLETAKLAALSDIASKFNAKVQETLQHHYQQKNTRIDETFETLTQVDIEATTLSHFEITQTDQLAGQIWVQVRLDKQEFSKSLQQKWQHQDQNFKNRLLHLTSLSSLEQLIQAQELVFELTQLELMCMQLEYANQDFDLDTALADYAQRATELTAISNHQSVRLVNDNVPADFNALIIERLAKSGIKLSSADAKTASANSASIQLKARSDTEQDKRGAHAYKITLEITSYDQNGRVIGKASHTAKGRSYDSANDAQSKAVASMAANLKKASVRTLLKLKS